MKKWIYTVGVFLLAVLWILPAGGCASNKNQVESGGIIWEYRKLSDGTLSVYPAFEKIGETGRKYLSALSGTVTVPTEIDGIAVTELEDRAFFDCTEITQIVLGEGITEIGQECFFGCVNLQKINFPDSLKYCGENALYKTALTSISVGANLRSFGENQSEPFFGCTSLKEIFVDSDNTVYASRAGVLFTKDMKTLICYPAAASAVSYTLPDTVQTIRKGAFSQCANLRSLTFPKSLKKVEDTFYQCGVLTEIYVPKEKLEDYREDPHLENFTVKAYI